MEKLPPSAKTDLDGILAWYVAEAGNEVAERFLTATERAIKGIRQHPGRGSPGISRFVRIPGLRTWPVQGFPYLVFYTVRADRTDILRILHSARDVPKILGD